MQQTDLMSGPWPPRLRCAPLDQRPFSIIESLVAYPRLHRIRRPQSTRLLSCRCKQTPLLLNQLPSESDHSL
jgi:hypothetical protein